MTMENVISSISEPTMRRPAGLHHGSVLVVLDVNKSVNAAALYWTLNNVARKDDTVKILGIVTHLPNAMGFMTRVDQSIRNSPNIMELQFEIATKKEAIWRTNHINEWCQRVGVKLEVDVKAGNNPKVIAIDEAKAMGAYHVVLDKNMKKDRKYFIDNLTCFVSRYRSSGGVDTIRSFAVPLISSNKLPPLTPKSPPGSSTQPGHRSKTASDSSNASGYRSMSSTSFELGGESSDEFSAQEGDPLSAPSTGDSIDGRLQDLKLDMNMIRTGTEQPELPVKPAVAPGNLYHLLRGPVLADGTSFYNLKVNTLRPTLSLCTDFDHGPRTPRTGGQGMKGSGGMGMGTGGGVIGQISVAPEMGLGPRSQMGREALAASLQTQASFNGGRKVAVRRPDKVSMDVMWPLMHWADCRRSGISSRSSTSTAAAAAAGAPLGQLHFGGSHNSSSSMVNFRTAVRKSRVPVSSGLGYGDMIDSD